jgi:hypothetical protein
MDQSIIKILGSECQTSGTHAKRAKQATKKENAAACLYFLNYLAFLRPAADRAVSKIPWVVSRGRSYGFLYAGSIIYKHVRKYNPTPASSQVKLLITNNAFFIVQRATAKSKTGILCDVGVADAPPGTPAYSPVSDRRHLTALVQVHWARRVQAPMSQISGPNLQENHIIETFKEEGRAVSTQETAARRKWEMDHLTRASAPWTDSRPHP